MGLCASSSDAATAAENARNRAIEQDQRKAASVQEAVIKLLLIGTGDSGKTTLRKQMRRLYGQPFTDRERSGFVPSIAQNLVEGTMSVILAMDRTLRIEFSTPEARTEADKILTLRQPYELTPSVVASLKVVLKDAEFKRAVSLRSKYQLQDCWDRFASSVFDYPTWGGPTWIPSMDECVASRIRTSGINEENLLILGTSVRIIDVGGQRSERRKWLHSFETVQAIIFVCGISEYDLVLFEDAKQNRLVEAFELFRQVTNQICFQGMPVMLFLNKRDLFEKKFVVDKIPLNISGLFPDAPDNEQGVEAAFKWISQRFQTVKSEKAGDTFTHITTATDPGNVKTVVDDVTQIVLKASLEKAGFVS